MKIFVASENPMKVNAVKKVFNDYKTELGFDLLEVEGISVDSGVSHTPFGEDVLVGANNRIINLKKNPADFYVSLEGGIENNNGWKMFAYAIIDNNYYESVVKSMNIPIPDLLVKKVKSGIELGPACDQHYGTTNLKQNGGLISILSKNNLTRQLYYESTLISALVPFINKGFEGYR